MPDSQGLKAYGFEVEDLCGKSYRCHCIDMPFSSLLLECTYYLSTTTVVGGMFQNSNKRKWYLHCCDQSFQQQKCYR